MDTHIENIADCAGVAQSSDAVDDSSDLDIAHSGSSWVVSLQEVPQGLVLVGTGLECLLKGILVNGTQSVHASWRGTGC